MQTRETTLKIEKISLTKNDAPEKTLRKRIRRRKKVFNIIKIFKRKISLKKKSVFIEVIIKWKLEP